MELNWLYWIMLHSVSVLLCFIIYLHKKVEYLSYIFNWAKVFHALLNTQLMINCSNLTASNHLITMCSSWLHAGSILIYIDNVKHVLLSSAQVHKWERAQLYISDVRGDKSSYNSTGYHLCDASSFFSSPLCQTSSWIASVSLHFKKESTLRRCPMRSLLLMMSPRSHFVLSRKRFNHSQSFYISINMYLLFMMHFCSKFVKKPMWSKWLIRDNALCDHLNTVIHLQCTLCFQPDLLALFWLGKVTQLVQVQAAVILLSKQAVYSKGFMFAWGTHMKTESDGMTGEILPSKWLLHLDPTSHCNNLLEKNGKF